MNAKIQSQTKNNVEIIIRKQQKLVSIIIQYEKNF